MLTGFETGFSQLCELIFSGLPLQLKIKKKKKKIAVKQPTTKFWRLHENEV
jgi:hypothetical protein